MTDLILIGLGWMYMCGRRLIKSINQGSLIQKQMAEDEVNKIGESMNNRWFSPHHLTSC